MCVAAVADEIVTKLPAVPTATNDVTVVVVAAVNLTVFGAPIVKTLKVFAPVKVQAPVPAPVIVRLLYIKPPPAKVLSVAEVCVSAIVESFAFKVSPVAV